MGPLPWWASYLSDTARLANEAAAIKEAAEVANDQVDNEEQDERHWKEEGLPSGDDDGVSRWSNGDPVEGPTRNLTPQPKNNEEALIIHSDGSDDGVARSSNGDPVEGPTRNLTPQPKNNEEALIIEAQGSYDKSLKVHPLATIKRLVAEGVNLEATDGEGNTALMISAFDGKLETLNYLIAKGANLNHQSNFKKTALHHAAGNRFAPCVESLLKAGADTSLEDEQGSTALDEVKAGAAEAANTAAQAAAAAREYDSLAELFGNAQAQFGLEVEPEPEPAAPPLSA